MVRYEEVVEEPTCGVPIFGCFPYKALAIVIMLYQLATLVFFIIKGVIWQAPKGLVVVYSFCVWCNEFANLRCYGTL